jgi:hypothetical protein
MKNLKHTLLTLIVIVLTTFIIQCVMAQVDSLVLYLPFDEGAGAAVKDLSGNGNNGTIKGAKWVDGKINKALEFDGKSLVDIPNSDSLSPTEAITVMAWINMGKSASGELAIVSKGQWAANDLPYELSVTPGGNIFWQFYDDAGRDGCSPTSPLATEWHHIAGTYDGAIFKCYIDGVMKNEFGYIGKLPKNTANVAIGKRSKAEECYFVGMIDEVAIFSNALSENAIKSAMTVVKPAAVDVKGKLPLLWGKIKHE